MKKVYAMALMAILTWGLHAQPLTGTKNIPGDYASIAAAVADLNTNGVGTGGVTFNVAAGHTETILSTIVLTATGTAANPIVFQKSGVGANPQITAYTGTSTPGSASPDGIWALSGSDYVTIDGIDLLDPNTSNPATMEFGFALFKASAADGCQNVTIKNCTITLNRVNNASGSGPMVEGSVGILVINSTRTAATTALTPSAASGSNSNNKFYGNTIQNCNYGIALSGFAATAGVGPNPNPLTFLGDLNNDIGGTSASTGNTILNYGGAPSATNPAAGIRANHQWSINISYNTLNNNDGAGVNHPNTLRGIFAQAGLSANATISYNNVTIKGGGTTQQVAAIESGMGATPASNTVNITNNTITGEYLTATSGASFFGIFNSAAAPATLNITNNSVTNLSYSADSLAGSGAVYPIYTTGSNAASTFNVNNNTVNNISRTGTTGGTTIGIFVSGGVSGMVVNANNNVVSNMSIGGSGTASIMYGIQVPTSTLTVNDNQVYNLSCIKTSGLGEMNGIRSFASPTIETYSNNLVYNLTHNGTGIVRGIYAFTTTGTRTMSGNTVHSISGAGTTIIGIENNSSSPNVFKNKIYNIQSTSTSNPIVSGMLLAGLGTAGTANIYNNLIADIKAPNAGISAATVPAVRGINITTATPNTTISLSYNTVYLDASSSDTNFGSAALFVTANATATTAALTMRNNIFVNVSTAEGTGKTVAYQRSGTALANFASASNNNLFYAGTPSPTNLIFYDGTNSDQTLSDYKTRVAPRDAASVTENPPFQSTSGSLPDFLKINLTIPTQIESGGVPISGITDDYYGTTRNASTPDIGGFEGNMTPLDLVGPSISYTTLSNDIVATSRVLTGFATITDPSGVNTTSGTRPRIYYKKSTDANNFVGNTSSDNGWKFVEASNTSSPFDFTVDYTLLNGGGVSVGDVIQYFVVAQDMAPTPNVGINSGTFATAPTSVALVSGNFPISGSINTFNIVPTISGTVTVGTGGDYPSLTGAGGLFADINAKIVSGNIVAEILDNLTETGANALNQFTESGGPWTLTIRPADASSKTISGSFAGGLIRLNGADRVTIDGRFGGSGSWLTFQNTSTSSSAVFMLISSGAGQGATNNTIRNCTISTGTIAATTYGIHLGGSTLGSSGADNDDNSILNNTITVASNGIYAFGTASTSAGGLDNLTISGNSVTCSTSVAAIGIRVSNVLGSTISGNEVDVQQSTSNAPVGISLETGVSNTMVSSNVVKRSAYTGSVGYGGRGITVGTGSTSSNITLANNVVYGVTGDNWSAFGNSSSMGIVIGVIGNSSTLTTTTGGINLYYNSVNMYNTYTRAATSTITTALYVGSGASNLDIRNNVFANSMDNLGNTTSKSYAIYSVAAASAFTTINYNDYYPSGPEGILGFISSADVTTLTAWQTATGQDGMSISRNPSFTSSTDLTPTDFNGYFAQPISGITTDITGATRSATAPAKGAYEGTVPGVWLGSTAAWTNTANWSHGAVPTASTVVAVINSSVTQPEISSAVNLDEELLIATGCTLTVKAGGSLTMGSASALANNGNVLLEATASGYGSLLEQAVRGSGTFTRQMYLNASTGPNNARWYTIGSPFAVPINQLHDGTSEFNVTSATESPLRRWDASTGDYVLPASATENFIRGLGYVAYFGNSPFGTFIRPIPGAVSLTGNYGSAANLTATLGYTNTPTFPTIDGPTDGWNCLANPYLTSYDWNGQTLGPNTGAAIYIRNSTNTGWVAWNTSETSNRRYIPPMQGFWIRTTVSEPLTADIAQRSTNSTQVIEKPGAGEVLTRIKVTNTANGYDDQAVISFHNNGTPGFDRLYDGYKLRNDAGMHNVYSRSGMQSFALNYLPAFTGTASVPVWFESDVQGTFTFHINRDEIDPTIEVTLEDKQTNATFVFQSNQSAYTFTHTPQMNKDRFVLHYNQINVGQHELISSGIKGLQAWYFDGRIHLKSLGFSGPVTARLVDVSGKRIAEEVIAIGAGELTRWSIPSLRPGVYMVQLISREGQTTVKFVY
jgi:hypothetical protein